MKCSKCGDVALAYAVSVALHEDSLFVVHMCRVCALAVIGDVRLARLKRISGRAAWVQPSLPLEPVD